MNSQQESALFREWGWVYDYVGRKWVSPDGTTEIGVDFMVKLTQEPDGDLHLMRAIVEWGQRHAEPGG